MLQAVRIPNISTIGAYDVKKKRVLIMDVDRESYEPYWTIDEIVLKAMATKTAAFGFGGYIIVSEN